MPGKLAAGGGGGGGGRRRPAAPGRGLGINEAAKPKIFYEITTILYMIKYLFYWLLIKGVRRRGTGTKFTATININKIARDTGPIPPPAAAARGRSAGAVYPV